jgi:4-diphosphocytidyl-2-C-methyl-D-erythritol kinase
MAGDLSMNAAWPAPAKLNLFLHITGRRADGYHNLQTVFQFLDLCDFISFQVREDGLIRRVSELAGVDPAQDLVVRAARRLQETAGASLGVDITVDKRLPMGAGLGGGSSDAATTLVALNRLWGLGLPESTLAELGVKLGADVPIFIHGRAAWAEGVGEHLTSLSPDEPWYLVIWPDCHVSTAELFADPQLTRNTPPIRIADFLSGQGRNDFEPVARVHYPKVKAALDWLAERGEARLTGTGSCVFASFTQEQEARGHLASLPAPWHGYVARGLNRSPLLDRLDVFDRDKI